jgi:hypothetical protein
MGCGMEMGNGAYAREIDAHMPVSTAYVDDFLVRQPGPVEVIT